MIALLDTMGPAVWRASWQATAIALVVALLVRLCGERMPPRWRYLLWSVVLVRLLLVATPASPWSAFNLVRWQPEKMASQVQPRDAERMVEFAQPSSRAPTETVNADRDVVVESAHAELPMTEASPEQASHSHMAATPAQLSTAHEPTPSVVGEASMVSASRMISCVWLAGCLLAGWRLLAAALALRRRLSACRVVTDRSLTQLLEAMRERMGLKRTPALLVSPDSVSPSIVGAWNPRIVVPESIVTESSRAELRRVLAHELAHVVRGDLWTNWLLLAARVLHWFNPVAWWVVREMQSEREAACDELALAALGQADRSAYATTLVELAARLTPSTIAPGMIGLFASARKLRLRVERLVRSPAAWTIRPSVVVALLVAIALVGLTDRMPTVGPNAVAQQVDPPTKDTAASAATAAEGEVPPAKSHSIHGRCVERLGHAPLQGIRVVLVKWEGRTLPGAIIRQVLTDAKGQFEFKGLVRPRPYERFDRLAYEVFALHDDRPTGNAPMRPFEQGPLEISMNHTKATLSGRVVNEQGKPVEGANVIFYSNDGRPVPGLWSAVTDSDGRFAINHLLARIDGRDKAWDIGFTVVHPDYPETRAQSGPLPADVIVKLPVGCVVTGTVLDEVLNKPTEGAMVTVESLEKGGQTHAFTDANGHYRLVVPEGRYNIMAEAVDRVCIALTDQEFLIGKTTKLPPLKMIAGGFIAGQVIDTATGKPVVDSESGGPIMLGFVGPSQPVGRVMYQTPFATVDDQGRFKLRVATGDNYPYFVNIHGDRMAWDTRKQPPVVVKDGETTTYNMLITPPVPPQEKLKAAQAVVSALPAEPAARTKQIVAEFRKLNHTVDETELWCSLMRELVAIGRDAVPILSAELDRATEDRLLRRLAFALRAIGDARAVPALIRSIPRALQPAASDYGLIVADGELTKFMQAHDLSSGNGGTYFDFGRAVREINGALRKLTAQDLGDAELFSMHRSEDPRRAALQRRLFAKQAKRWQTWWEEHWRELTDDEAYRLVKLPVADDVEPAAVAPAIAPALGPHARLAGETSGATLSPAAQEGAYAHHFLDLDTGFQPKWPAHIPLDESKIDFDKLAGWAKETGVDLMCITHRAADGTSTFVLRAFDMQAWEISDRDKRNLEKSVAAGALPKGREVRELLMHYDAASQRNVPDANAAFLYVTREGNRGLIETTDRVTRTENLTGGIGDPPKGVGFFKGVRFNLKAIVP